jgi:hypothetical protein
MAKNKTTETEANVNDFIKSSDKRQADSFRLVEIMKKATGHEPRMWGPSIIGFGSYHYQYASGHQGDAPLVGFSPRKSAISLYLTPEPEKKGQFLARLGKFKMAVACIYINKLDDIDSEVLTEMITNSVEYLKRLYP